VEKVIKGLGHGGQLFPCCLGCDKTKLSTDEQEALKLRRKLVAAKVRPVLVKYTSEAINAVLKDKEDVDAAKVTSGLIVLITGAISDLYLANFERYHDTLLQGNLPKELVDKVQEQLVEVFSNHRDVVSWQDACIYALVGLSWFGFLVEDVPGVQLFTHEVQQLKLDARSNLLSFYCDPSKFDNLGIRAFATAFETWTNSWAGDKNLNHNERIIILNNPLQLTASATPTQATFINRDLPLVIFGEPVRLKPLDLEKQLRSLVHRHNLTQSFTLKI